MKRVWFFLLAVCMAFLVAACGEDSSPRETEAASYCVECGGQIAETDKFCSSCGKEQ